MSRIRDLIYGMKELSEDVANARGCSLDDSKAFCYAVINCLKEAFTEYDYDRITIKDFGTFRLKPYDRNVSNHITGKEITDEKDYVPRINFSASDKWKDRTKINVSYDKEGNRIVPKYRRGRERKKYN